MDTMADRFRELYEKVEALAPQVSDVGKSGEKMSAAKLARKKRDFAEAINLGDSANMTPEKIAEHAIKWMEIVDRDQNGTLSLSEFHEFFNSMDGIFMTEHEICQIFESYDETGDGQLSIEEFARAITQAIVPDEPQEDEDDEDDEEDEDDDTE
jgi:Ca2+-binding EF-hand superfamily protein